MHAGRRLQSCYVRFNDIVIDTSRGWWMHRRTDLAVKCMACRLYTDQSREQNSRCLCHRRCCCRCQVPTLGQRQTRTRQRGALLSGSINDLLKTAATQGELAPRPVQRGPLHPLLYAMWLIVNIAMLARLPRNANSCSVSRHTDFIYDRKVRLLSPAASIPLCF